MHTDGGRFGGLALAEADFGQPDLIEDAAAHVPFASGLAGPERMDCGLGRVILPSGWLRGAQGQLDIGIGGQAVGLGLVHVVDRSPAAVLLGLRHRRPRRSRRTGPHPRHPAPRAGRRQARPHGARYSAQGMNDWAQAACAACYAHASDRMRDDLKARPPGPLGGLAARQGGHRTPHSPGPAARRTAGADSGHRARPQNQRPSGITMRPSVTRRDPTKLGDREKMISQIPPRTCRRPHPRNWDGVQPTCL